MQDPQEQTDCKEMEARNAGVETWQVGWLAGKAGVLTPNDIQMNFDSVLKALNESGPIWTAGKKAWGNAAPHEHVVVIFGVSDTGVLIHDPEPVNVGTEDWKTWSVIRQYIDRLEGADHNYITCP